MAERRMFAKSIIDSDAFLDMPLSTQALYFHLSMRADDEGFVGSPKRITAMIGAKEDDLKILLSKRFLLGFESGVVVIKHWRIHNYLQKDRTKLSNYIEEKSQLFLDKNKSYTDKNIDGIPVLYQLDTNCIQNDNILDTQNRLDKIRLDKISINKKESIKEKGDGKVNSPTPLEKKKDKKTEYIKLVQASNLSTKVQEQILEWLEYKKWKYTEMGIKSLLTTVAKNVDKYGESAVCGVIVESMGNMWQGICWDKLGRKEQRQENNEEAEYIEDGEYLIFKKTGARIHKETYASWSRKDN